MSGAVPADADLRNGRFADNCGMTDSVPAAPGHLPDASLGLRQGSAQADRRRAVLLSGAKDLLRYIAGM